MYPKHVAARAAIRAIEKALIRIALELKLAGKEVEYPSEWLKEQVAAYRESPAGNRGRLTPYPATWFNQSRYLDDQNVWYEMTPQEEQEMRMSAAANVGVWRPS